MSYWLRKLGMLLYAPAVLGVTVLLLHWGLPLWIYVTVFVAALSIWSAFGYEISAWLARRQDGRLSDG